MSSSGPEPDPLLRASPHFVTTHWTAVLQAQNDDDADAEAALTELCRDYWYPLYAFVRRQGYSPHDAEDLTQGFFARLLEKKFLANIRPDKGRFRSFLLIAVKRFLANERDRARTAKRGGRHVIVSIDQMNAETRLQAEPFHEVTAEKLFDRHWAQAVLDRVMEQLRREYADSGRSTLFERLRASLGQRGAAVPYREVANQLGVTEAAVKMAVQRLRGRYRVLLRQEIARTVRRPEEIEEELRDLFAAFDH